jgi:guanylate kinase
MANGTIFIISAPSGTGKTTILKKVISELENVAFSISHTTRLPRPEEEEGDDYFFVDRPAFETMQKADVFLEWAEVHGNFYGTSRQAVEKSLANGRDIILDIDIQGAHQVREKIGPEAVFVFIVPPSLAELENRLRKRGTDTDSVIEVRLQNARRELADMERYDYVIMNDVVGEAVQVLRSIIIAERSRKRRAVNGTPLQLKTD